MYSRTGLKLSPRKNEQTNKSCRATQAKSAFKATSFVDVGTDRWELFWRRTLMVVQNNQNKCRGKLQSPWPQTINRKSLSHLRVPGLCWLLGERISNTGTVLQEHKYSKPMLFRWDGDLWLEAGLWPSKPPAVVHQTWLSFIFSFHPLWLYHRPSLEHET